MEVSYFDQLVELFDSKIPDCEICGETVVDADSAVCYYEPPGYICEWCFEVKAEKVKLEAEAFVEENVIITNDLPKFDEATAWTISPEEYKWDRVSNTENAYRTCCRHHCTNYDYLIRDLSQDDALDQIKYWAIREAADGLVDTEIQNNGLIYDSRETSTDVS